MFRGYTGYTNIIQLHPLPGAASPDPALLAKLRKGGRSALHWALGGAGGSVENGPRDPGKMVKSGDFIWGYNIHNIYIYHIFLFGKMGIYIYMIYMYNYIYTVH
jgi:hypothetical protein